MPPLHINRAGRRGWLALVAGALVLLLAAGWLERATNGSLAVAAPQQAHRSAARPPRASTVPSTVAFPQTDGAGPELLGMDGSLVAAAGSLVAGLDPRSGRLLWVFGPAVPAPWLAVEFTAPDAPLPGGPSPGDELEVAAGHGRVWVLDQRTGLLYGLDPRDGVEVGRPARLRLRGRATAFAVSGGQAWVLVTEGATGNDVPVSPRTLLRERLAGAVPGVLRVGITGRDPRFFPLPGTDPEQVLVADGAVWVLDYANAAVLRLDPASGRVLGSTLVDQCVTGTGVLQAGAGRVWAGMPEAAFHEATNYSIVRPGLLGLDPATGGVALRVSFADAPAGFVVAGDRVLVSGPDRHGLAMVSLDPRTGRVLAVRAAGVAGPLAEAAGSVWVSTPAGPRRVAGSG